MAVSIRLLRKGRKKAPHYRIVVADRRSPRDGRFIEIVGYYNPLRDEELFIDLDKVKEWENKGAKPTSTVEKLIKRYQREHLQTNESGE